jgi:hypothetical protein
MKKIVEASKDAETLKQMKKEITTFKNLYEKTNAEAIKLRNENLTLKFQVEAYKKNDKIEEEGPHKSTLLEEIERLKQELKIANDQIQIDTPSASPDKDDKNTSPIQPTEPIPTKKDEFDDEEEEKMHAAPDWADLYQKCRTQYDKLLEEHQKLKDANEQSVENNKTYHNDNAKLQKALNDEKEAHKQTANNLKITQQQLQDMFMDYRELIIKKVDTCKKLSHVEDIFLTKHIKEYEKPLFIPALKNVVISYPLKNHLEWLNKWGPKVPIIERLVQWDPLTIEQRKEVDATHNEKITLFFAIRKKDDINLFWTNFDLFKEGHEYADVFPIYPEDLNYPTYKSDFPNLHYILTVKFPSDLRYKQCKFDWLNNDKKTHVQLSKRYDIQHSIDALNSPPKTTSTVPITPKAQESPAPQPATGFWTAVGNAIKRPFSPTPKQQPPLTPTPAPDTPPKKDEKKGPGK